MHARDVYKMQYKVKYSDKIYDFGHFGIHLFVI